MQKLIYLLVLTILSISVSLCQTALDDLHAKINQEPDSLQYKHYTKIFGKLLYENLQEAKRSIDSAYHYAQKTGDAYLVGRSIENTGSYYFMKNELDSALVLYRSANEYYQKNGLMKSVAGSLINIGNCLGEKGDLLASQKAHHRSLSIQDSIGITGRGPATNYLNLGVLYSELNDNQAAMQYYRSAKKIFDTLDDQYSITEVEYNMALSLYDLDSLDAAQDILAQLETYHRKNGNTYALQNVLTESGKNYYRQEKYEKGERLLLEALDIAKEYDDGLNTPFIHNKLMELYIKTGDLEKGEYYALLSYNHTLLKGNMVDVLVDLKNLSTLYADKADYKKSLLYITKYHQVQDSIFAVDKMNALQDLKLKYETEKKEAAISRLNQEVKISNLKKGMYGGGLIASILLLISGYFYARQKAKNESIKRNQKEHALQQEIEYKRKELASQTLHLVQKNTFIKQLTEKLQAIKNDITADQRSINHILSALKVEPELDKDWNTFKSYFTEVHNDFDERIKSHCPNINDNEMRLAYLMRMKLNASEISTVLRVLPESVRKSKYRLKKKLGLSKEEDLGEFLISVDVMI